MILLKDNLGCSSVKGHCFGECAIHPDISKLEVLTVSKAIFKSSFSFFLGKLRPEYLIR